MILQLFMITGLARAQMGLPADVNRVFQAQCVSCHQGAGNSNSGGIGSILDPQNLLQRGLIVPQQADVSEIIRLMRKGEMPKGGNRVDDASIATIAHWIQSLPPPPPPTNPVAPAAPIVYDAKILKTKSAVLSQTQAHGNERRDGLYVEPTFLSAQIGSFRLQKAIAAKIDGAVYGQPLFIAKGSQGHDVLLVVTEKNNVYAINVDTDEVLWTKNLGPAAPLDQLPCGNIDPLGITGTPVVDAKSDTVFLDSMQAGKIKRHLVYRLSIEDGSTVAGWPVDVATVAKGFQADVQNQRGALALNGGTVYIPYGGHWGDCGTYHGWVIGLPIQNPKQAFVWKTDAGQGGIWAPGGISSDGSFLFAATGNTSGADQWGGGEAYLKFPPDLKIPKSALGKFSNDYFYAPSDWQDLDNSDIDISGVSPIPLDLPGGSPRSLLVGFGKNGFIYIADRNHLGGIGGALIAQPVATSQVITAPAAYLTPTGAYVVFRGNGKHCPTGQSGDLTAVRITNSPKLQVTTAWCANQNGTGSPIVTTTNGFSDPIVWSIGAENDNQLHAFNGETGQALVTQDLPTMEAVQRFESPLVAQGRIYVAGGPNIYVYAWNLDRQPSSLRKKK